ncbi:MAG: ParB/RepB/Spo0J family partition protein [Acidobacteria bacterium]|nr:ParB/RepB/Spo0J family partition protein [Acidobacteriota bacterium]
MSKALGKGLNSLLPGRPASAPAPVAPPAAAPSTMKLDQIRPNENQPRTNFDNEKLAELAESIRANGIIQPLIIRKRNDHYQIIAGERRWRAARLAGLEEVPVVVQDLSDTRLLEVALIENIQREDLNAIEIAIALDKLSDSLGLTHEEIAARTGKSRATITNFIRLLRLPADVQTMVAANELSLGHAKVLLSLDDERQQLALAQQTVKLALSVRHLEAAVKKAFEPPAEPKKPEPVDPNVKAAIDELQNSLGTRVRIVGTTKGRIEIDFYSPDDLDRIYSIIVGS